MNQSCGRAAGVAEDRRRGLFRIQANQAEMPFLPAEDPNRQVKAPLTGGSSQNHQTTKRDGYSCPARRGSSLPASS